MNQTVVIRKLLHGQKKQSGRNHHGCITAFHRGGGHPQNFRYFNYYYPESVCQENSQNAFKPGVSNQLKILRLEKDPNRTGFLALTCNEKNVLSYVFINTPQDIEKYSQVKKKNLNKSNFIDDFYISKNYAKPLKDFPLGTEVCNIELRPGQGSQICRALGSKAKILLQRKITQDNFIHKRINNKTNNKKPNIENTHFVLLRLPSAKILTLSANCLAVSAESMALNLHQENLQNVTTNVDKISLLRNKKNSVNNIETSLRKCASKQTRRGKAGQSRWLGRRPIVRGVAMNPIDHPHGGGEGKGGPGRPSVSAWGKLAKGKPTRSRKRPSHCKYNIDLNA